jgi:hypothetical protein
MKFKNNELDSVVVINQFGNSATVLPGGTWYSHLDYVAKAADSEDEYYGLNLTLVTETDLWSPFLDAVSATGGVAEDEVIALSPYTKIVTVSNRSASTVTVYVNSKTLTDGVPIYEGERLTFSIDGANQKLFKIYYYNPLFYLMVVFFLFYDLKVKFPKDLWR